MAHPDTCRISFTYAPVASMWVVALHSLFLYSDLPLPYHPPSDWLRLFSSPTFPCINTPVFSTPVILHTYLPMKMDQTVFRNVGILNSDAGELPRRKHTSKTYMSQMSLHRTRHRWCDRGQFWESDCAEHKKEDGVCHAVHMCIKIRYTGWDLSFVSA